MPPSFDLSVILAEAKENPDVGPALAAIERACAGIRAEILVVRPAGRPALPPGGTVVLRDVIADEDSLVPDRWGLGVAAAQAPVFGCLTTELTVHPEWARTLLDALRTGAGGAAGTIALQPGTGMVAAAVYFVRFNAFLPRPEAGLHVADNIPGDTAAYRRDAVMAYSELLSEGFWEAEFHRRFKADGVALMMTGRPLASFHSAVTLRSILRLRARHGHGFGVTRVARDGDSAARILLAAPAVPIVLLVRIVRRAARSPGALLLAIRVLPVLALICGAWAWGEAAGASSARRQR